MIKAIKLFIGYILRSLGASFVIIWDIPDILEQILLDR